MAPRIAVAYFVPERNLVLVQFPAQAHHSSFTFAGEIDEPLLESLEVDAELTELDQIALDLRGQPPHVVLERRHVA